MAAPDNKLIPPAPRTAAPAARIANRRRVPRFLREEEPWLSGFFGRVKDFLTERPVKLPASYGLSALEKRKFGEDFRENLREFFRPTPPELRKPIKSRMAVDWKPRWATFWENLHDLVSPPKLPPLKVSGPPVKVRDIWSKDEHFAPAQSLSFLVHVLAGLLILIPIAQEVLTPTQAKGVLQVDLNAIDISPYAPKLPPGKDKAGGGGGGGERNPVPASKGRLPRPSLSAQLTPPVVEIKNLDPKLPAEPTVFMPPDIKVPQPNLPNYGDPLAGTVTNSAGPGSGAGIGTGSSGGVGSGSGPGVGPGWGGGIGGGAFRAGRDGVGEPVCAYCPTPQFSEEARKAKHQGSVVLRLIVTSDGRATNISVVKGLGLGLDEKAVEAVRNWRFKPAIGPGGKVVPVWLDIEVVFRLL